MAAKHVVAACADALYGHAEPAPDGVGTADSQIDHFRYAHAGEEREIQSEWNRIILNENVRFKLLKEGEIVSEKFFIEELLRPSQDE